MIRFLLALLAFGLFATTAFADPPPVTPVCNDAPCGTASNPIAVIPAPTTGPSFTDASTNVGLSAGNLTFAHTPTVYLSFCNEAAAGGGYIAISDNGAAVLNAQPSHTLWPGGCFIYENTLVPTGVTWSAIASVASTPLRVEYR